MTLFCIKAIRKKGDWINYKIDDIEKLKSITQMIHGQRRHLATSFLRLFKNLFIIFGCTECPYYTRVFYSCGKWGLFFIALFRLLIAVASRYEAWALGSAGSVAVATVILKGDALSPCFLKSYTKVNSK